MSQISGSWSAELDTSRLAEQVAQRTAVLVVGMLRAAPLVLENPAGSELYDRSAGPDPGAGARQGPRHGGVTDDGTVHYDQEEPG